MRGKREYSRPTLVVYGSVREFTKGDGWQQDRRPEQQVRAIGLTRSLRRTSPGLAIIPWVSGSICSNTGQSSGVACGHGRHFGVMADEVERIVPEAVSVHPNGYRQVDYALLGVFPARH